MGLVVHTVSGGDLQLEQSNIICLVPELHSAIPFLFSALSAHLNLEYVQLDSLQM